VECFSYHKKEHPMLTKKAFEWLCNESGQSIIFYEENWLKTPIVFFYFARLLNPLKLFYYEYFTDYMQIIFENHISNG
jgi:hypothetical protein